MVFAPSSLGRQCSRGDDAALWHTGTRETVTPASQVQQAAFASSIRIAATINRDFAGFCSLEDAVNA
jgi:hypothetical protein